MKIRKIILPAVLCLAVLITACSRQEQIGEGDSYVYCLNESGTGLIKVVCDLPDGETQETAEAVLEKLSTPAEDIEYMTPIPEGVKVENCELLGGILEIDFSGEYSDMGNIREKLMRAAVVQSLVRIDGVNAVAFTVAGEPLTDKNGMEIGLMNEDDFVETTASSPSAYQTDTLTLYFANKNGDKLVAKKVDVRYSSNVSKDKLIVEKLMQGPGETGGFPTINPDTNLLSVTTKDKICYVNFDNTFLTGAYDILPELTVYSIVNSLVEGTEATQVQITINGETNATYMETVDLAQPFEADMDLVAADEADE